jgi:bifunctional oligoribonuclease and PAP phosphatase NrnA
MSYFPENENEWTTIAHLINRTDNIFITTHVNPDGDAIGSEIALSHFLKNMGKTVSIVNTSPTPEMYRFLDPHHSIKVYNNPETKVKNPEKNDLMFSLDFGRDDRAGESFFYLTHNGPTRVVIDHHIPEETITDIAVINTRAAATGSLLFDLMNTIGAAFIDRNVALALMTAIVTDTGNFRFNNTTATTHRIAAALHEYGATAHDVSRQLETGFTFNRQKLLGLVLGSVSLSDCGRIAYAHITEAMFRKTTTERENTEGIIEHIRSIKNITVAILFIQENHNTYKISIRTKGNAHANIIATLFSGGGHPQAAGATLKGSLKSVTARVLKQTTEYLDTL